MFRIIKHVLDTKHLGLKICPKVTNKLIWNIILWSDSDWGGDKDNRLSVSGMALFVCVECWLLGEASNRSLWHCLAVKLNCMPQVKQSRK